MESKALSIFAEVPAQSPARMPRLVRGEPTAAASPAPAAPAIARVVLGPRAASSDLPPELQRTMLDVLASKPDVHETIELLYRRVERELGELFARLTPVQARALKLRLEQARDGDLLAARFNRLIVQRRERLLAFLGDARRRQALAALRIPFELSRDLLEQRDHKEPK